MRYTGSHLTVMVTDFERALLFYTGTLGFDLVYRAADHYAVVRGPDVTLGIHPAAAAPEGRDRAGVSVGLSVTDMSAAVAELRAKGVEVAEPVAEGGARRADFADPDGMPLYLWELAEQDRRESSGTA